MLSREQNQVQEVRKLAELLDSRFQGPFGFRFGLDGLLGLIPGIGDLITTGISLLILGKAADMGCPPSTLLRMSWNIAFENIIDTIPLVGNVFDFMWKSNLKNLALLESHLRNPAKQARSSRVFLAMLFLGFVGLLALTGFVTYEVIKAIYLWASRGEWS